MLVGCFRLWCLDTVRITKVKGYEAANFGCWRVDFPVTDARRKFSGLCGRWYPVVLTLHRFFVAISRAVADHVDGDGTAPVGWCMLQVFTVMLELE